MATITKTKAGAKLKSGVKLQWGVEPAPDVIPDVVGEPAPDVIPDVVGEPAPDVIGEPAPDVVGEPAPDVIPDVVGEPALAPDDKTIDFSVENLPLPKKDKNRIQKAFKEAGILTIPVLAKKIMEKEKIANIGPVFLNAIKEGLFFYS